MALQTEVKQVLCVEFACEEGKTLKITINRPGRELTADDIKYTAEDMIATGVLAKVDKKNETSYGAAKVTTAYTVRREMDPIDL